MRDVNTGPLARPFARSLTHLLIPPLLALLVRTAALIHSLAHSLTPKLVEKFIIRCLKITWFCPIVRRVGASWFTTEESRLAASWLSAPSFSTAPTTGLVLAMPFRRAFLLLNAVGVPSIMALLVVEPPTVAPPVVAFLFHGKADI